MYLRDTARKHVYLMCAQGNMCTSCVRNHQTCPHFTTLPFTTLPSWVTLKEAFQCDPAFYTVCKMMTCTQHPYTFCVTVCGLQRRLSYYSFYYSLLVLLILLLATTTPCTTHPRRVTLIGKLHHREVLILVFLNFLAPPLPDFHGKEREGFIRRLFRV